MVFVMARNLAHPECPRNGKAEGIAFLPAAPQNPRRSTASGEAMRATEMLTVGLVVLLSACTAGDGVETGETPTVATVDWSLAVTRTLRFRQNEFAPVVVTLRQGRPYVLKLENADDVAHAFSAPDFFQAIAVQSLVPAEQAVEPGTVLSSIDLPPGQTRELAFVPVRDGYYSFADGWTGRLLGGIAGTPGLIIVEAIRQP